MKVGFVGVGAMGNHMATHVMKRGGYEVWVYDIDKKAADAMKKKKAKVAKSLGELGTVCDVVIVMVGYDHQVLQVVSDLAKDGKKKGCIIVITATSHPDMVLKCAEIAKSGGMKVLDAPVCFGLDGAEAGKLVSTVGGEKKDFDKAKPVLECYSRAAYYMGPHGTGELGKTINNMLHWVHSIANQEVLLLGKVYGIDPKKMREMLLNMPGTNGTLDRWDETRFTWQEKDLDIALDLAQTRRLALPLFGCVDQLIKLSHQNQISDLLTTDKISYLGRELKAAPPGKDPK
jgi:3-hydroxyisobutyrate dehydrogenase-like beta-hydroxyacid dehydrogenase